jgi:mannosyltransferase
MPARQAKPVEPAAKRAIRVRAWRTRTFFVLLIVMAAGLRFAHLTAQSLWADEGNSVRLTERPLGLVIAAAQADVHPPGYYLLLWGWAKLFGEGEAAVRALSAVIGIALVGLVYLIGKQWFGARAGWLAAFAAAVSPFQVAYSQEVRMYVLVAFLGAGATYAFARWLEAAAPGERWLWAGIYVLAIAAGLWTHYSFPVVVAALGLAWLVWWIARARREGVTPEWWRAGAWWLAMHVGALILYLPWLSIGLSKSLGYGAISASHPAGYIVAQALKFLSVGESVPDDDLTRWLTVGMVGLGLFGAWGGLSPRLSSGRHPPAVRVLALSLLVVMPIAMMVALTLMGRPAYRPKFFLVASPAFCVLVGAGIALLEGAQGSRRTLSAQLWLLLGLGVVGIGAARSLRNYYLDPSYARADYRGIAAFVRETQRPGDAILLDAPNQWEVFTYYYRGSAQVYPLCRSRPPREEEVVAELTQIAAEHPRLFALYWATEESDPERIVERWLEEHAYKALDRWYGDVRLVMYAVQADLLAGSADQYPIHTLGDVRLGDAIALRGYSLAPAQVQRGDILQVALLWEALRVPTGRYKVFLHLVNADGQIAAQYDGEPGHGMDLTSNWTPGRGVFTDRYGVLVSQGLPAGEYRLLMGMYDVSGAPRLPIAIDGQPAGDALTLATVQIH